MYGKFLFSFPPFRAFFFCFFIFVTMSLTKEVSSLLREAGAGDSGQAHAAVSSVVQEVNNLLTTTGDSFEALCLAIETASSRPVLKSAFQKIHVYQVFS